MRWVERANRSLPRNTTDSGSGGNAAMQEAAARGAARQPAQEKGEHSVAIVPASLPFTHEYSPPVVRNPSHPSAAEVEGVFAALR
jgi:hypothetical protein